MSTTLDLANPQASLPQKSEKKPETFAEMVRSKVSTVLVGKKADDFVTALISLTQQDPALNDCLPMSLVSTALQAQSLNLSLNKALGQAWIIPFKENKIRQINPRTGEAFLMASFQIGYKGYIQLAIRSGYYRKINVLPIREGELNSYDPLNEEIDVTLIQDEIARESAPTIGYYAMFEYLNGFRKTMYWSKGKMLAHADRYSPAFSLNGGIIKTKKGQYTKVSFADFEAGKFNERDAWMYSSFWYKDFDGMALKTMIRQILTKWGVMSVEMQQAYEADMRVIRENGDFGDVIDGEYTEAAPVPESDDPSPAYDVGHEQKALVQNEKKPVEEPMTNDQRKAVMAHYATWSREDRLKNMSEFLGREVSGFTDKTTGLTKAEAAMFLNAVSMDKE